MPRISALQIGHCRTAGAHITQQQRCPQGRNTTPTSASRQILHVFCSRNSRFSSSRSINRQGYITSIYSYIWFINRLGYIWYLCINRQSFHQSVHYTQIDTFTNRLYNRTATYILEMNLVSTYVRPPKINSTYNNTSKYLTYEGER